MFGWFRRHKAPRKRVPTRIAVDDTGVTLFAGMDATARFEWRQVAAIRAWKWDLFTTDCICLGFDLEDGETTVCVQEELDGYTNLVEEMERRCAGFKPGWWQAVAFPAFETNMTTVWTRPGAMQ